MDTPDREQPYAERIEQEHGGHDQRPCQVKQMIRDPKDKRFVGDKICRKDDAAPGNEGDGDQELSLIHQRDYTLRIKSDTVWCRFLDLLTQVISKLAPDGGMA